MIWIARRVVLTMRFTFLWRWWRERLRERRAGFRAMGGTAPPASEEADG
jgi:hypothetical protein